MRVHVAGHSSAVWHRHRGPYRYVRSDDDGTCVVAQPYACYYAYYSAKGFPEMRIKRRTDLSGSMHANRLPSHHHAHFTVPNSGLGRVASASLALASYHTGTVPYARAPSLLASYQISHSVPFSRLALALFHSLLARPSAARRGEGLF